MATNTKKVIILIDGQNLYYNLKEMGVVEKDIQWDHERVLLEKRMI